MADPQNATPSSATPTTPTPPVAPLSIPDFAAKVRERAPQLTPELVDDATLVRKVLERRPDLTQYVQGSEPRPKLRRGREEEADAHDEIMKVLNGRDPKDLSYRERFRILSIVGKEFARQHAKEWGQAKDWREKLHALIGTTTGVAADVTGRIAGGATEPKNLAIGATGLIDPVLPASYFFFEGAGRLPGEAKKLAKDPSYENIVSTGLTATQVAGSAAAGIEGAGTGVGTKSAMRAIERGGQAGQSLAEAVRASRGNPEIAEKIVADAKKAKADYDAQVVKINHQYAKDVAKREAAMTEATADYVEKVAKAREEWVKNTAEAHHARKGSAMIEAHRQKLDSSTKALTTVVDENVKNVEKLVHADLDRQFAAVRDKVQLEPATDEHPATYPELNADYIRSRVKQARAMLQGAPEDLKVFNDLVKQMAKGEDTEEGGGGKVDVNDPGTEFKLNWDEGRTQSSALSRASASESISGNVRRAIRWVLGDVTEKAGEKNYVGLDGQLQLVADQRGAGKAYAAARQGWRQYQEDFHDMSSEKGGGSPLARVVRGADPAVVRDELNGKAGDRLIETFGKYTRFGASPKSLAKLRNLDMELNSLPKSEYIPEPVGMERIEPPKPEPPAKTPSERIEEAEAEGRLKAPPTPQQMMETLKEAKRLHARDVGRSALRVKMHDVTMGALTIAHVFKKYNSLYAIGYTLARLGYAVTTNLKETQEYLARITPQDVKAINEAYADDPAGKAELQEVVTEGFIKGAATDRKPALARVMDSKALGRLLSPAQMGRVLRAYKPIGQAQPEQKKLEIAPPQESPMEVTVQQ